MDDALLDLLGAGASIGGATGAGSGAAAGGGGGVANGASAGSGGVGRHRAPDPLPDMFAAWREDVLSRPMPPRVSTTTAARVVAHANKRRTARPMIAVAASIFLLLVASAIVGSRNAQPGDALFPVTQVLWADRADSAVAGQQVNGALDQAKAALRAGNAQRAFEALVFAAHSLHGVRDTGTHQTMQDELTNLYGLVVAADPMVPYANQAGVAPDLSDLADVLASAGLTIPPSPPVAVDPQDGGQAGPDPAPSGVAGNGSAGGQPSNAVPVTAGDTEQPPIVVPGGPGSPTDPSATAVVSASTVPAASSTGPTGPTDQASAPATSAVDSSGGAAGSGSGSPGTSGTGSDAAPQTSSAPTTSSVAAVPPSATSAQPSGTSSPAAPSTSAPLATSVDPGSSVAPPVAPTTATTPTMPAPTTAVAPTTVTTTEPQSTAPIQPPDTAVQITSVAAAPDTPTPTTSPGAPASTPTTPDPFAPTSTAVATFTQGAGLGTVSPTSDPPSTTDPVTSPANPDPATATDTATQSAPDSTGVTSSGDPTSSGDASPSSELLPTTDLTPRADRWLTTSITLTMPAARAWNRSNGVGHHPKRIKTSATGRMTPR
jgi:hypothetical protein